MGIFQCCFTPKVENPGVASSHGVAAAGPSSTVEPDVRVPFCTEARVSTTAYAKAPSGKLRKLVNEKEWTESALSTAKDATSGLEFALSLQAKLCAAGMGNPFPEARAGFLVEVVQKHLEASVVRLYVMASGYSAEAATRPVEVFLVQLAQALSEGSSSAGAGVSGNGCRPHSGGAPAVCCEYLCPKHEPVGSSSALLRQALVSKMPVVLKRVARPGDVAGVCSGGGAASAEPPPRESPTLGAVLGKQLHQAAIVAQCGSSSCSSYSAVPERLMDPAAAAAAASASASAVPADPQCCPDLDLTESDAVPGSSMIFCAVPLVYGTVTLGVLWIAAPVADDDDDDAAGQLVTSPSTVVPTIGGESTASPLPYSRATAAGAAAAAAGALLNGSSLPVISSGAAALLANTAALEHVAMAVAMQLAAGCADAAQLCRLGESLHGIAQSATLAELVLELCNSLVQQVRQRFFVDATAHAALVPAPDSRVAFMLRPERVELPSSARVNRQHSTLSRLRMASVASVPSSTGLLGTEVNRSRSTTSAIQATASASKRGITANSSHIGTLGSGSLPNAHNTTNTANASTNKTTQEAQRAYALAAAGDGTPTALARASSLSVLRASVPRDVFMLESSVVRSDGSFGMLSTCPAGGGVGGVGIGGYPPASLSARAFRLSNTLLQAMIQAAQLQQQHQQAQAQGQGQQQQGLRGGGNIAPGPNSGGRLWGQAAAGAAAAGAPVVHDRVKTAHQLFDCAVGDTSSGGGNGGAVGGGVLLGRCVRDCARHVQDERQPSRDVCMLMMTGGGAAAAAAAADGARSVAVGAAAGGTSSSTRGLVSEPHMGLPTGTSGGGGAQSLVLLGMETGDGAVLAVYLAFPTPAPQKLLEAVREACSVLMREHLANLVRHRLRCADLAAEWETLRAGVPGSYLSVSRCSLIPPDSHCGAAGAVSVHAHSNLSQPGGRRGHPPFLMMSAGSNVIPAALQSASVAPTSTIDDAGFLHGGLSSVRGLALSQSRLNHGSVPGTLLGSGGPLAGSEASLVSLAPGMGGQQHRISQSPQPSHTGMFSGTGYASTASATVSGAGGGVMARKPSITQGGMDHGLTLGGPSWLQRTRRSISAVPQVTPLGAGSASGARGMFLRVFSAKNGEAAAASGSANNPRGSLTSGCHGLAGGRTGGDGSTSPVGMLTEEADEDEQGAWPLSTAAAPATPPGGGLAAAGMLTVHDLDETYESWGMRAHMGALVDSIMSTTLRSSGTHLRQDDGGNGSELAAARVTEGLEELQLSAVLGQGASGVVLKGTLGCTPVAVKIMEMPDGDASVGPTAAGAGDGNDDGGGGGGGQADDVPSSDDEAVDAGGGGGGGDGGGGGGGDAGSLSDRPPPEPREVRARRALLRNAMEVALMRSISHVNIVQAFAVYDNVIMERHEGRQGVISLKRINQKDATEHKLPDPGGAGGLRSSPVCTAIVLELCDRGSLADVLHNRSFPALPLPPPPPSASPAATAGTAMQYARYWKGVFMTLLEIALALRHLHSRRLVHRDVKPGNILLKSSPGDPRGWTCKLADFGFSVVLDRLDQPQGGDDAGAASSPGSVAAAPGLGSSSSSSLGTPLQLAGLCQPSPPPTTNGHTNRDWYTIQQQIGGTVTHMAPEAFKKGSRIDATVDVFSFGIIMWELVCGRGHRPHRELALDAIGAAVTKGTRPMFPPGDHIPSAYRQLARSCWSADPRTRPTSAELVVIVKGLLESVRA